MNILRRRQSALEESLGGLKNRKKASVLEKFFLGKEWNQIQKRRSSTKLWSKGKKKNWVTAVYRPVLKLLTLRECWPVGGREKIMLKFMNIFLFMSLKMKFWIMYLFYFHIKIICPCLHYDGWWKQFSKVMSTDMFGI